ncbi:DUF1810 domain-containing protein [Ramlibacter rhizophilus]|uniref:DUF1810 domain-containing protein n=1 Tax=Ramlibacter rhizophilus TaxID=1781167 RepID=A0A4Z0BNJ0_9BURK|nr:DUF1810 domain-containing protein [Ramlibacter rhizophilus]TFY99993.1 DUF1810 domain-containing protein [Ramlibacter rhizophilus]
MNRPDDPFDLERFTAAQDPVWTEVQSELARGRKRSHWMWFVFPQLAGLGRSTMAQFYGLQDLEEARAYLAHPVLGERLRACCAALLVHAGRPAEDILGAIDAMKLRSSLTLFLRASPSEPLLSECLDRFFAGQPDAATDSLLARH